MADPKPAGSFKPNKEEQKYINKNKPINFWFDNIAESSTYRDRVRHAGMPPTAALNYSEQQLKVGESHKREMDEAIKDRAANSKAQYNHEKAVGGAMTNSYKEWKDLD